MATPSIKLIEALQNTARKLESGAPYQWGHMGSCNCGNLVQELTSLSKGEIHAYAMRGRGDWNDQIMDFCPTSGMPMDLLISELLNMGITRKDLMNLEKLSDPHVLKNLSEKKYLKHNNKSDLVLYLKAWAKLLESKLAESVNISDINVKEAVNQSVTVS